MQNSFVRSIYVLDISDKLNIIVRLNSGKISSHLVTEKKSYKPWKNQGTGNTDDNPINLR